MQVQVTKAKTWMKLSALILLLMASFTGAKAHHLLPKHDLNCNDQFPCPEELQRRVDFWIQVYKEWGQDTLVFHDRDNPYIVYSIIKDDRLGCSEKADAPAQFERQRIRQALLTLASNGSNRQTLKDEFLTHIQAMFSRDDAAQYQKAADRIRCQKGVKHGFAQGLSRFHEHVDIVDQILASYGLPKDIRYLPFVESLYYPKAYSKAGAAGLWQIMPATAKWLGLQINSYVDERLDVETATHGAAKYLVNARDVLGKAARKHVAEIPDGELNPFIITSYNYGIGAMRNAINSVKPDYLAVLQNHRSPNFQVAVQNFYASFLAARYVSQNSEKYFGIIHRQTQQPVKSWQLPYAMSVARVRDVFEVSVERLQELNPALTTKVWQGRGLLPKDYTLKVPYDDTSWDAKIELITNLKPESTTSLVARYQVKNGDTACGVAYQFEVKCSDLIALNNLGRRAIIRRGQWLKIPQPGFYQQPAKSVRVNSDNVYYVKSGDTLCGIAGRLGVSCSKLRRANNLSKRAVIYPGQKLKIPS